MKVHQGIISSTSIKQLSFYTWFGYSKYSCFLFARLQLINIGYNNYIIEFLISPIEFVQLSSQIELLLAKLTVNTLTLNLWLRTWNSRFKMSFKNKKGLIIKIQSLRWRGHAWVRIPLQSPLKTTKDVFYNSFSLFYSKYKVFSIYFVNSHMFTGLKKYLLNFFCRNIFSKTEVEV